MSMEVIAQSAGSEMRRSRAEDTMPLPDVKTAVMRRNLMVEVTKNLFVEGIDYGAIPGTGAKPTLLKPGAERLCSMYGLSAEVSEQKVTEDWTGKHHNGEPFFYYRYICRLTRNGVLLGEGIGSCNSWETKYRYRSGERQCPKCGKAAIIRGKEEYGGGWLCFARKGGCGAKFKDGDPAIERQSTGRVPNLDIADQVNTIQKMAHKRALVAAVLIATNASEFFTQDEEDLQIIDLPAARSSRTETGEPPPPPPPPQPPSEPVPEMKPVPDEVKVMWSQMTSIANMCAVFAKLKGWLMETMGPDAGEAEYYRILWQHGQVKHANELKKSQRLAKVTSRKLWESLQQADALRGEPPEREPGEGE